MQGVKEQVWLTRQQFRRTTIWLQQMCNILCSCGSCVSACFSFTTV